MAQPPLVDATPKAVTLLGKVLRNLLRSALITLCVLVVTALGLVAYEHLAARPAAEEQRAAEQGRTLFGQNCEPCHGANLLGHVPNAPFDAPPLRKPGFAFYFYTMPKDMEGFIAGLIGTGRGKMPAFQTLLSPEQRAALAAYLRKVNTDREQRP
jgi:mono/diheme cytochrome c family protein